MTQRKYITGEEWLYFKFYCGPRTADILLIDTITLLVNELKEKNLIHQWFFIRYRDPESHIRFRLNLLKLVDLGIVIAICNRYLRPFLESDQVWRLQTDTYVRELERYGKSSISYSEEIFHYESELILGILRITNNNSDLLQYVLLSVDSFLKSFNLSTHQRAKFYLLNYYAKKKKLEVKYGKIRVKLNEIHRNIITPSNNESFSSNLMEYSRFKNYLDKRNERISSAVKAIIIQSKNRNSDIKLLELLQSMVHMFFNKAFNNQQNMYEFLGYYILSKKANAELNKNNE